MGFEVTETSTLAGLTSLKGNMTTVRNISNASMAQSTEAALYIVTVVGFFAFLIFSLMVSNLIFNKHSEAKHYYEYTERQSTEEKVNGLLRDIAFTMKNKLALSDSSTSRGQNNEKCGSNTSQAELAVSVQKHLEKSTEERSGSSAEAQC